MSSRVTPGMLFVAALCAAGLLGLALPCRAEVINGNLQIGGFQPANLFDPNNPLVGPPSFTLSAANYAGFANATSPTVTVASYPVTFGFSASTVSDFFSTDTVEFTGTGLIYNETPVNGEQALRDITFTATPGYFDSLMVLNDTFNNGGISDTVSPDGSTLTLNWTGGLVAENVTSTFAASFAGSTAPATPLPGALPLFATGLGALGLLGWRRKRKVQA